MKKVFVVTYGGGHVNMIIPVVEKLKEKGVEVKVLGLTTAESVLKKRGIESFGFRHYLSLFSDKDNILKQGKLLMNELPSNSEILEEETMAYLGLSYWDLEKKLGIEGAKEEYAKHGRYCFYPTHVMESLFQFEKPDFVLATTSPRSEMAALSVSKKMGIANACVVDQYHKDLYEKRFRETDDIDHFFVPSDFEFDALSHLGIDESKITKSGNPAFESHFSPLFIQAAEDFKANNFSNKKRIITYGKAPSHSIYAKWDESVIAGLLQYVKRNPESGLIIRNHPNDLTTSQPLESVFFSTKNENIAMILHASDIVITQGSTVGIEANIVGKTVVQYIDPECTKPLIDQEAMGVAKKFNSIEAIINFLDQKDQQVNKIFKFDIWPSTQIADYIISRP